MTQIQVKVSGDRQVLQVLGDLSSKLGDLGPMLKEIGVAMVESAQHRFEAQTPVAPDGTPWATNAASTIEQYINRHSRTRKKDGSLTRKGQLYKAAKKPLTNTGDLRNSINYQLSGDDTVRIGSSQPYAAWQQRGTKPYTIVPRAKKALAFGGVVVRKVNHPGIPARPFLGFSDQDQIDILDIVRGYFKPAQN